MTYQFALILFLVVASQAQTNKPPTVLCHSTCNKYFNNNNNIFSNEVDMAKNLTKIAFFSDSYVDVVQHFGYYSSAFKQKQLATMLAIKEISRYRNKTLTAYGATSINGYISDNYPEGTCPLCSNLATQNNGVPPFPNMFEEYVPAETLTEEIDGTSFLIDIPIVKFPLFQFSRLLQPSTITIPAFANNVLVCPNDVQNLVQVADCFQGYLINIETAQSQYNQITIDLTNEQEVNVDPNNGVDEAALAGFAVTVAYKKFAEEILTSYTNCLNNIYNSC